MVHQWAATAPAAAAAATVTQAVLLQLPHQLLLLLLLLLWIAAAGPAEHVPLLHRVLHARELLLVPQSSAPEQHDDAALLMQMPFKDNVAVAAAAAAGSAPEEHDVALGAALRLHAFKHRLAVVEHLQATTHQIDTPLAVLITTSNTGTFIIAAAKFW
jgi:hypothetical protein